MSFDPREFNKLVNHSLPKNLKLLWDQIYQEPINLKNFSPKTSLEIRKRLGIVKGEASGCYVFLNRRKPFYVGISRKLVTRIRQHISSNNHNSANLAFLIARKTLGLEKADLSRSEAKKSKMFNKAFEKAKKLLREASVVVVRIDNPEELYLFELYAAMGFKTSKWNSFKTH